MKLLVDMNLSPRWVERLAEAGFEAEHWSAIGPDTASDAAILAYAGAHRCVVLTHDLDFGSILAATNDAGPSVVQLRADDVSPEAIGLSVVAALRQMAVELHAGALVTVDPGRTRLRVLPLHRQA
jgi:predicted nuclease of predicted toxin-antitoxin system